MTVTKDKIVPFDKRTQARGRMAEQAASKPDGAKKNEPTTNGNGGEPIPSNVLLPVTSIDGGENPRQMTDEAADKELVASITKHGILQPIRVRPSGKGRYQVVAGGRRYAAAKEAGLSMMPVFIATPTDDQAFQQALVENLQRANLNPIDEAKALLRLLADGKMTQKQVGAIIGKSQSYVANAIGLLEASPAVQKALESGKINVASAKAMRTLPEADQNRLVDRAQKGEVNSKDIEYAASEQKRRVDQEERSRKEQEELAARISEALTLGKAQKTLKAGMTVTVDPYGLNKLEVVEVPKGLTLILRDWNGHKPISDGFECSCTAFALRFAYSGGEANIAEFTAVCIVPEHAKAHEKKLADAKREVERKATDKVKALKKALEPNLTSSATELSEEGWTTMAYSMMLGRPKDAAAFAKKQGVAHPKVEPYATSADPLSLWKAVEQADTAALVGWVSSMLVEALVPDVYRMYTHEIARHAHVRQYLVDRFGLDAEFVWGGREKELQVGEYAPKEPTEAEIAADVEEPAVDPDNETGFAEQEATDGAEAGQATDEAGPTAEEVAPEGVAPEAAEEPAK